MKAKTVARLLRDCGFKVTYVTEGDAEFDGEVGLTEMVSVQVAYRGPGMCVCVELPDGCMVFGKERSHLELNEFLADVRAAVASTSVSGE